MSRTPDRPPFSDPNAPPPRKWTPTRLDCFFLGILTGGILGFL